MSAQNILYQLLQGAHSKVMSQQDPGNGKAIYPEINPCVIDLITAGAETRDLPDPLGSGQILLLGFKTDGGDCVVTASSAINQTGNTQMTFTDPGEFIALASIAVGSGFKWRTLGPADGVALGP